MKVLLTGAAGFIGMHVCERLLARGDEVIGVDNLNDYYDVALKEARLARLTPNPRFRLSRLDIADRAGIAELFERERPQRVINLAAQAGVRYSLINPHAYVDSNVVGFVNILEGCRHAGVEHFVYASSSSIYGGNERMPFSEHDNVDHPVSLYAATKKSNELMAHTYSHLFNLPTTGLRFFTVYGPWGRPGHGAVPVRQGDHRRQADRCFQPRQDAPRLHLYRRHRRRRDPRARPSSGGDTRPSTSSYRTRRPAGRRIACSISATTSRSN
jgi:UDP-glucuronate 4-epimerase